MTKADNFNNYKLALQGDIEGLLNEIFKNGINDKITSDLFYALNKDKFIYDCIIKNGMG